MKRLDLVWLLDIDIPVPLVYLTPEKLLQSHEVRAGLVLRILQEDGLVSRWVAVPREVWKVGGGGHYLAQVTKCDRRAGQVVLCYKVPQWSCIFQTTAARAAVTESPHDAPISDEGHRPCIL